MFQYYHQTRRFGSRRVIALTATPAGDMRFFLGSYLAGTAFALAYLF